MQVLLLDELTTFLDGEDQRGVLEAVRACVGGPEQACNPLSQNYWRLCCLPALCSHAERSCSGGLSSAFPLCQKR